MEMQCVCVCFFYLQLSIQRYSHSHVFFCCCMTRAPDHIWSHESRTWYYLYHKLTHKWVTVRLRWNDFLTCVCVWRVWWMTGFFSLIECCRRLCIWISDRIFRAGHSSKKSDLNQTEIRQIYRITIKYIENLSLLKQKPQNRATLLRHGVV